MSGVPADRLTVATADRLLALVTDCRVTARACVRDGSDDAKQADTDAIRALVVAMHALVDWSAVTPAEIQAALPAEDPGGEE